MAGTSVLLRANRWLVTTPDSRPLQAGALRGATRATQDDPVSHMSDLPQTEAGIPYVGIDPTAEQLERIVAIEDVFRWLGSSDELGRALYVALGGAPKFGRI